MAITRSIAMKHLGMNLSTKKTRKAKFSYAMERVVPWAAMAQKVEPHYPRANTGRPPLAVATMRRIHWLQQRFCLSDPAMEEALHHRSWFREFAKIDQGVTRLPDRTTIVRFRRLLERHNLAPDVRPLVNDSLLHGEEEAAFGDAGYQGVHQRPEAQGPTWHVAMRPDKRRKLSPFIEPDFVAERVEKMKASIRARVEHPFRVIKRQFGFTKVRYRGLAKNMAQRVTPFTLSNLWLARRPLAGTG